MLPQEHNENTIELDTTEGQPTMLGRGQRRKEISVRLRDYVTHTIQIMSPSMPSPLASQRSSGLLGARPASVPLEQNHRLALSTSSVLEDPERYRRLVGHGQKAKAKQQKQKQHQQKQLTVKQQQQKQHQQKQQTAKKNPETEKKPAKTANTKTESRNREKTAK
ncbi:retrovirus-related Pol polyprotein from transposon TNT 1-94 [Senna tora]|uniref:Retrovirus-related Pol polyprotein from transposon TNT 1-94 n=1 Tax=Senna tora TaxID=362788 RepID=A0A834STX8_9FABA|nr:retrovirus-related Pol polyprotein from transposon TNT 1-94 [Senna tora]